MLNAIRVLAQPQHRSVLLLLSEVTFFHLAVVLVNDDDGAKVDLVRSNDKDDIAEDILKSLERLEAILALGLLKYFA